MVTTVGITMFMEIFTMFQSVVARVMFMEELLKSSGIMALAAVPQYRNLEPPLKHCQYPDKHCKCNNLLSLNSFTKSSTAPSSIKYNI